MTRGVEHRCARGWRRYAGSIGTWHPHLVAPALLSAFIGSTIGAGIARVSPVHPDLISGVSDDPARMGCTPSAWSRPLSVAPSGQEQRVAGDPRLALGRRHSYVVGVNIQTFGADPVPHNPLTAWEIGGRDIGRPTGQFAFLYPRGAVDARDRLHLFWGEPRVLGSNLTASAWAGLVAAAIWTATYDAASGWSTPYQVPLEADLLRWRWTGVADNLGDAALEQGIGLSAMRPASSLPYLSLGRDGSWRRTTLPAVGAYTSVATDRDRIVVAYAAADSAWATSPSNPTHEDANSVFVRSSADGGATWSPPVLVQRGGTTPAHEVKVLLGKQGEVHLLWIQATPAGAAIRQVVSRDGARWPTPDDLLAPGMRNMRAVIDACGRVQLVIEDWRGGAYRTQLVAATWDRGWSAPVKLFPDLEAVTPDLRTSSEGDPVLAFVGRPLNGGPATRYATYYARLEK